MANAVLPAVEASFQKIKHVVVLMLENRSFDHLVSFMRANNPNIAGLKGNEFNYWDPSNSLSPQTVGKATSFTMPFDPGHEFMDVQLQLYGPKNLPSSNLPHPQILRSTRRQWTAFFIVPSTRHNNKKSTKRAHCE
jgi:hypothetical protein